YDLALLQEPHFDFRGLSRATRAYNVIYPPGHVANPRATRSLIFVNTQMPSSNWKQIPILSPDVTAIEI
ncbi:hypothetical protein B0H13DRAFT_1571335, partial [Mycena leptocephala]